MNTDDRFFLRCVQFVTVGAFSFGLTACDPKPVLDQADSNTDKASRRVDDLALNIKVEDALKENSKLKSLEVKVSSVGGVVTLSGISDTEENSKLATQIVMSVSGVKSVQNKLVVVDG